MKVDIVFSVEKQTNKYNQMFGFFEVWVDDYAALYFNRIFGLIVIYMIV